MADNDAYQLWLASPYGQVHQQAVKVQTVTTQGKPSWVGLEQQHSSIHSACDEIIQTWQNGLLWQSKRPYPERAAFEHIGSTAAVWGVTDGRSELGKHELRAIALERYFYLYKDNKAVSRNYPGIPHWRKFHDMYRNQIVGVKTFTLENTHNYMFVAYMLGTGIQNAKDILNDASAVLELRNKLGLSDMIVPHIDIDTQYASWLRFAHYRKAS